MPWCDIKFKSQYGTPTCHVIRRRQNEVLCIRVFVTLFLELHIFNVKL